jgi:hypothetical protein
MTQDRGSLLDQLDALIFLGVLVKQLPPERYICVARSLRSAARTFRIAAEAKRKQLLILHEDRLKERT